MSSQATVREIFKDKLGMIGEILEYNPSWENGTGYLNHAVQGPLAPELAPGQEAKSVSPEGREIILIGTIFGNILIFRRYQASTATVYVGNYPSAIKRLLGGSRVGTDLDPESLTLLVGSDGDGGTWPNIGARISQFLGEVDSMTAEAEALSSRRVDQTTNDMNASNAGKKF